MVKEICNPALKSKDKNPICHALITNNLDFIKAMAKTTFNFGSKNNNYYDSVNAILYSHKDEIPEGVFKERLLRTNGLTVLHYACVFGRIEIVNLLIENFKNSELNQRIWRDLTPFHLACIYGQKELVKAFFNKGKTSPMMEENQIEIVTSNIDFNAQCTFRGYTPLHYACREGNVQAVACMLEHFREIDWNTKSSDRLEDTPLHLACKNGHLEIIKLMAENSKKCGINLTVKNNFGLTPLEKSLLNKKYVFTYLYVFC